LFLSALSHFKQNKKKERKERIKNKNKTKKESIDKSKEHSTAVPSYVKYAWLPPPPPFAQNLVGEAWQLYQKEPLRNSEKQTLALPRCKESVGGPE